ncbi:MAG: hypothetical protein ACUZ8H_05325 [Candidatus Anammoxibacter sp.]
MTDTQKDIEALKIIDKEKRRNKVHFKGEQTFIWEETETIRSALKLAEAVEKDLANGWVMVPSERTFQMSKATMDCWQEHAEQNPTSKFSHALVQYERKGWDAAIAAAPKSNVSKLKD